MHFRAGGHAEAAREYSDAIAQLNLADGVASVEQLALLATCLANRAAARLQLADGGSDAGSADAEAARDDCSASLAALARAELGAPHALWRKVLFRRALARERLGALDGATTDLACIIRAQARAGEPPADEAMDAVCRLLAQPALLADGALADAVEALLAVLSRGLELDGLGDAPGARAVATGGGAGEPPHASAAAAAAPSPQLASPQLASPQLASVEHKWQAYTSLLAVLSARGGGRGAPMRAFVEGGGPRIAHRHLHSMEGVDWMADAKRGTVRAIDALMRLPTVRTAAAALELNPHGLHAPLAGGTSAHGPGCSH